MHSTDELPLRLDELNEKVEGILMVFAQPLA